MCLTITPRIPVSSITQHHSKYNKHSTHRVILLQAQDAVMSSGPSTQEAAYRDAQLDQLDKIKQQLAEAIEREEALQATVKKLQDEQLKQVASRGSSCRSEQPVLPTNAASSAQQQPQRATAGANDFSFYSTPAPAHPASLESLQRPHVGQSKINNGKQAESNVDTDVGIAADTASKGQRSMVGGSSTRALRFDLLEKDQNAEGSGSSPSSAATSRDRSSTAHVEDRSKKIPPTLEFVKLQADRSRSPFPIWKMANLHVKQVQHHFAEPAKELNQLHRPMICNMSYWKGDELRTCIMARIFMIIATEIPKQKAVFGSDQIPQEHGGGPWYAAARSCFEPTRLVVGSEVRHTEVVVKGLTQLSKTPETICQAFFCFFAEGVLPFIMVRNRGGANVGKDDMYDAVLQMNLDISVIFDEITKSALYSHHPEFDRIKDTDFHLTPRCTSGNAEWVDIHGPGNYALKYPQVIISCTNVNAVNRMTETSKGRSLGSNMQMSAIEFLSGYRLGGDRENANPHVPYIWNLDAISGVSQKEFQKEFQKAAIALLFDEDDANRSSTGREKTDKLLHQMCPRLSNMVEDMKKSAEDSRNELEEIMETMDEDDEVSPQVDVRDGQGEKDGDREAEKFYTKFKNLQLRARVARVYTYTATPITLLHEVVDSASKLEIIMIELTPGRNYVGYTTEKSRKKWPWLQKDIEIMPLPNRVGRQKFPLSFMYPKIMRKYFRSDFKDDDPMPHPFHNATNGRITLYKKDTDELMTLLDPHNNNEPMEQSAGWLKNKALKSLEQDQGRMTQFWREDGNNLVGVLRDIHEKKQLYPQGYRNLLYMTNFSKLERDQVLVVQKVLSLDGGQRELVDGLICMEFTYKHVRFSWRVSTRADGAPFVDPQCMSDSAKSLMNSDDPVGFSFGKSAMMSGGKDGEIQTLEILVPNINWGYSVLWKYMETKREYDSSFFLKVMVVTGEIGARGVRYKTAKTHKFVLTDMYHAFAVSNTQQITAHGTGVVQAIGRLCTMSADISECPTIKLWIPEDCWSLVELWMECLDLLPDLLEIKRKRNILTMDELLAQVTQDNFLSQVEFPNVKYLRRLLTAPTGHNKSGDPYFSRPSHLLKPAKDLSNQLFQHPNCQPVEPLQLGAGHDERRHRIAEQYVEMAAMDESASDEAMPQDPLLPWVAPGEKSFPEPKSLPRRTVNRNSSKRMERDLSKTHTEVMAMVKADSDLSDVYNIAEKNFSEDIGTGNEDGCPGTMVVDAKLIDSYGGTAEDFAQKLQSDREINVEACLLCLVTLKVLQASSNFPAGRRQKKTRYWLMTDRGSAVLVDDDRLDTRGDDDGLDTQRSVAKRGRPQGEKDI
jgi:hypothetical protein